MKTEGIKIKGYTGTWYVVDERVQEGQSYYLLESEIYGDEAPALIVTKSLTSGELVITVSDVQNGLTELDYKY